MFNPELFGQAAAELMTVRLDAVQKDFSAIVARLAVLEKAHQESEIENAALRERVKTLAHDLEMARNDIEVAVATIEDVPAPEKGEKGDAGERGEKGDTGAAGRDGVGISDAIIDARGELVLTFTDGRTKTLGTVRGEKGEKGEAGVDGKDGRDGAPGIAGVDGKDGIAGRDGVDGKDGCQGVPGEKGERGEGVRDAIIDNAGNLILTFTDGQTKSLGRVVGESFSDFQMEYLPDTHEIDVRATCAGITKSLRYPAGGIRALGYWREGKAAKAGEAVSLGGCLYIARKDTKAKPTYDHPDWFLAVQRGRDMTAETKGIQRNPSEKAVSLISAEAQNADT